MGHPHGRIQRRPAAAGGDRPDHRRGRPGPAEHRVRDARQLRRILAEGGDPRQVLSLRRAEEDDLPRAQAALLERVWGYDSDAVENHVEVYVGFLRKKLSAINSNVRIEAVRRLGYRLEVAEG